MRAFVGLDRFDQSSDVTPGVVYGSPLCMTHPMLDLGKGLLD
jgi:hypothetical protein